MSDDDDQFTLFDLPPIRGRFDDEYYTDNLGHLPWVGNPDIVHAVGNSHPDVSVEANVKSASKQAVTRVSALKWLYERGDRGTTVAEFADSHPKIYSVVGRNEASIPFIWLRKTGWAMRVKDTDDRDRFDDEQVRPDHHIARKTSESASGIVQMMTEEGRAEYEKRVASPQGV